MFNILPEKEKKAMVKDYQIRLLVVVLWFVFVTGLFSIIFLIPMYVLSSQSQKAAENTAELLKKSLKVTDEKTLVSLVDSTNTKISLLQKTNDKNLFADLFGDIVSVKEKGIKITLFSVQEKTEKKKTVEEFKLSGKSDTRNTLLSFAKSLEELPFVEKVELPISNYAKETDISFSVIITRKK